MAPNNSNNHDNDSSDLNKIDSDITNHRLRAFLLILLVGVLYLYLVDKKLPENAQSWGPFGDFIGGILNPIFALFAFYWLTYSVRLQIKELKDTRTELKKAADAQVETSKHQENIAKLEGNNVNTQREILKFQRINLQKQIESAEQQQKQIAIQNFESLFFQLLTTKTDALKDIYAQDASLKQTDAKNIKGKDAIKHDISTFKSFIFEDNWEKFYQENLLHYWGSYFRICYQIVKLIDQSAYSKSNISEGNFEESKSSSLSKKYFDIFRATLTQYELEALFFNCLCIYGAPKFKNLLTKYGLFEPLFLDYDRPQESFHRLTRYAYHYDTIAFESSTIWKNYFDEISLIDVSFENDIVIERIKKLNSLFFINRTYISLSITNKAFINSPYAYELSNVLKKTSTEYFLSTLTIRKIKRQNNSPYMKITNNIKNLLEIINSSQAIITAIIENNGPNIDNNTPYYPDIYSSNKTTINFHQKNISENKEKIRELKNNLSDLNSDINSIKNDPYVLSTLILVKYGISYIDYQSYITEKL